MPLKTKLRQFTAAFLATFAVLGIAHAYTTFTTVNSNGQFPLYNEGSTKLAAVRAYAMRYDHCGFDCVGDTCTRVWKQSGFSCPSIVKAKNCADVTPYAGNSFNSRYCAMLDQNNAVLTPTTLYYTLHEIDPVWYFGSHLSAAADLNAQTFTTGL